MTPMVRRAAVAAAATLSLIAFPHLDTTADAATPRSYANCAALNKVYKHGVARKIPQIKNGKVVKKNGKVVYVTPKDKVAGKSKPVTTFEVNGAVYVRNDGVNSRGFLGDPKPPVDYKGERDLDRDNDGVACEKK